MDNVRNLLLRATATLERAGIPYAVAGGNAVAAWVSRVDPGAARHTRDVDILIRRDDLEAVKEAMTAQGFVYQQVFGVDLFLDGPDALPSCAVHLLFAGEYVKPHEIEPLPDVDDCEVGAEDFRFASLNALVRMKLTSYRRKDQVHISDMLGVGLLDGTWPAHFPPELAERLQHLIDTPDG